MFGSRHATVYFRFHRCQRSSHKHTGCFRKDKPDLFYIKIGMDGDEDITCTAEEDIELCTATARKYGLSLNIIDLHRQYWDNVVAYAIDKVKRGLTPNPDVMCNKLIKFGCFEQEAGHLYDKTATGHYASILEKDGKIWLGTAQDPVKDHWMFPSFTVPNCCNYGRDCGCLSKGGF